MSTGLKTSFIHSFITLYFSNSSNISLNSSSIILLSLKAFETCEVIVSSFAEAIVLIFSCFSALEVNFFTLYLPIILRNPVKSATPSIAISPSRTGGRIRRLPSCRVVKPHQWTRLFAVGGDS